MTFGAAGKGIKALKIAPKVVKAAPRAIKAVRKAVKVARRTAFVTKRKTIASKITGYTRHGLNQAISREGKGVKPSAILDAVKNPRKVTRLEKRVSKCIGKNAVVVLNKKGKIITTWAKNSRSVRVQK